MNLFAGTYMVTDTATGRGVLNLAPVIGGSLQNLNFVCYVVKSSKVFVMESDVISPATPLLLGTVLQQQTPTGGFTNASLNGGMVIYFIGGAGQTGLPGVGLITGDGIGGLTLTRNGDSGFQGTYVVPSDGRTDIQILSNYVAAYLVSANEAFIIAPDSSGGNSATSGFGEAQTAGPLTNSSVQGRYVGSTISPASLNQTIFSGEFNADGASPNGTLNGTEDISAASGARLGVATTATYSSISSVPTNGRGTWGTFRFRREATFQASSTLFPRLSSSYFAQAMDRARAPLLTRFF